MSSGRYNGWWVCWRLWSVQGFLIGNGLYDHTPALIEKAGDIKLIISVIFQSWARWLLEIIIIYSLLMEIKFLCLLIHWPFRYIVKMKKCCIMKRARSSSCCILISYRESLWRTHRVSAFFVFQLLSWMGMYFRNLSWFISFIFCHSWFWHHCIPQEW